MIYTVGYAKSYDEKLASDSLFKSKGGSVWKTIDEVKDIKVYIIENNIQIEVIKGIYLVDADWDDVINGQLTKPAKIISKVASI